MKRNITTYVISLFVVIILTAWVIWIIMPVNKTAFIQTDKVFNGFKGKIELERKLIKIQQANNHIMDSLSVELKILDQRLVNQVNPPKELIQRLQHKEMSYRQLNDEMLDNEEKIKEQYIAEVWKQINQYITDYGKNEGYDYIHGADGSGSLMYASEKKEISEDIIKYINERYEGK